MDLEEKINVTTSQIAVVKTMFRLNKPIYLSVDEWAPFSKGFLPILAVAQYFNSFIRHADVVKMANYTMFTSLLGNDKVKGTFKTPLFHTFKLFSNNCLGNSVDAYVRCDTFNTSDCKGIPYLDVTSVYVKETNTLVINVVNRHKDKAISTEIISNSGSFSGKALTSEVNSDDILTEFTFDKQQQYIPVTNEVPVKGNKMTYTFPAHSFVQIKVKVEK
jgi:alpha-N-arabinofuranosidase